MCAGRVNGSQAIHSTIDVILTHRKTKSMPDAELDELRARLAAAAADGRIAILQAACATNFFTSAQALKLVETMDSTFDQARHLPFSLGCAVRVPFLDSLCLPPHLCTLATRFKALRSITLRRVPSRLLLPLSVNQPFGTAARLPVCAEPVSVGAD